MKKSSADLSIYRTELHVHTVLSPCASVEMIPPLIVDEALSKGIKLIAITDHNAIGNIAAVMQAAEGTELTVLPGIEFQSREEVHSLCLFEAMENIEQFFNIVFPSFTTLKNNSDFFGEQFIVDKTGEFLSREERLLITSSSLTLNELWRITNQFGGLMIPAHVNRAAFGMIPVLGMIPTDLPFSIVEINRHLSPDSAREQFPQLADYSLIRGGDAHMLAEIRGFNSFMLKAPTLSEIKLAVRKEEGRNFQVSNQL